MLRSRSGKPSGVAKLLATLMIICLTLMVFARGTQSQPSEDSGFKYIILIDAGSSGSRIHVQGYKIVAGSKVPVLAPPKTIKEKPGLSSFANNPNEAGNSLIALMEFAKKELPAEIYGSTPVYLKATAGLRSIDSTAAENILVSCREELTKYPFLFQPSWAEVISGKEEGISGWVAANFLSGVFSKKSSIAEPDDTFGIIEMGGASLQVTFAPTEFGLLPAQQQALLESVEVAGLSYQVYTHSYLGYGLEKAQEKLKTTSKQFTDSSGNPCVNPVSKDDHANYKGCTDLVRKNLFDKSNGCHLQPCSFNGVFQPLVTAKDDFLAIENFFYTTKFFGMETDSNFNDNIRVKGQEWCAKDLNAAQAEFPNKDSKELLKYCFSSAYIPELLEYGLGLSDELVDNNVKIAHAINGVDIDWALGAVIMAIEKGQADDGISWGLLLALATAAAAACGYFFHRRRNNSRSDFVYLTKRVGGKKYVGIQGGMV